MSNYLSYVSRDSTNSIQGYSCESYPKPGSILPENLSVKQEPKVTYIREQKYIFISSSHRNTTSYPKHYDYRIKFERSYKNVKSVELISVTIPNSTNILDEPVIIFDINELNYIDFPSQSGNKKVFAAVPINSPNKTTGGFITLSNTNSLNKECLVFPQPIGSLDSITVKLLGMEGTVLDFGSPNGSTAKADQHSFILKITTEEKSRAPLQNRNVY